jgi:hypothetical protein
MSTDILSFKEGQQDLQTKGLSLYLAIAVPLTALTFVAWYIIYRTVKKGNACSEGRVTDEACRLEEV